MVNTFSKLKVQYDLNFMCKMVFDYHNPQLYGALSESLSSFFTFTACSFTLLVPSCFGHRR